MAVRSVADFLALDTVGPDTFRSVEPSNDHPLGGLYGGHALAIGLRAAGLTVTPDRLPHSVHGYFLRRGLGAPPLDVHVARDTDGRSFSARRVTISQSDKVIFTMTASFHVDEAGPETQVPTMPTDVADPETATSRWGEHRPVSVVEVRDLDNRFGTSTVPTRAWGRASAPIGDDPLLHACALLHFCDLYTGLPPMPGTDDSGGPSLDHAFWFHRPVRMDDWVLMDLEPVSTAGGRGLYLGSFYDRAGVLVASLAQEVLYSSSRPLRPRPDFLDGKHPD